MGAKKNVTVDATKDEVKIVKTEAAAEAATVAAEETSEKTSAQKKRKVAGRSEKYVQARSQVDKSKFYSPLEAIELVQKTSYSGFVGTISADLVLKEVDNRINVSFPHQTGKTLRVAIVNDDLLKDIEAGKLDFDILLTTPAFMPKLAKLARILGPKGLMPNPKNETIIADPEKKKAELLGGKTVLKTERKAPLLHVSLGKADLAAADLAENLQAVLKAVGDKALKATVCATMSPSVKVALERHN
ncbi:MAG: hypothetical protein Q4G02_00275 [bacterium]|nr:hypothetical protein [bacterium]